MSQKVERERRIALQIILNVLVSRVKIGEINERAMQKIICKQFIFLASLNNNFRERLQEQIYRRIFKNNMSTVYVHNQIKCHISLSL